MNDPAYSKNVEMLCTIYLLFVIPGLIIYVYLIRRKAMEKAE